MPTMMPLTTVPTLPSALGRRRHDRRERHQLLRHASHRAQREGSGHQAADAVRQRRRQGEAEGQHDLDQHQLAAVVAVAQRQQQPQPAREAEQRDAGHQVDRGQADVEVGRDQGKDRLMQ
jgi:hypothetical protein